MGKGRKVAAREAVKERLEPGLGACAAGGAAGWAAGALWRWRAPRTDIRTAPAPDRRFDPAGSQLGRPALRQGPAAKGRSPEGRRLLMPAHRSCAWRGGPRRQNPPFTLRECSGDGPSGPQLAPQWLDWHATRPALAPAPLTRPLSDTYKSYL